MSGAEQFANWLKARRVLLFYALVAAALICAAWALAISARRSTAPVVETVTTGAARPALAPTPATPVYRQPRLPPRDLEVERVGDRVAEAMLRLKKRQPNAALSALARAKNAADTALATRRARGDHGEGLVAALSAMDETRRVVQRGDFEGARRRLVALEKELDALNP
jgi:hypothetical protein